MESELYQWIRQREQEGTLDSHGRFTLAQEKAWEKLGTFQLPFEQAWVLKLVQAAVCAGASSLEIVQSRTDTQFKVLGELDWSWPEVEGALFDLERRTSKAIRHLTVGVRALAKSTTRPFSLKFGAAPSVTWDGHRFECSRASQGTGPALTLTASHFDIGESQSLFSLDNLDAHGVASSILNTLREYCFTSSIPITLDGRSFNELPHDKYYTPDNRCRPVAFVTVAPSDWLPDFSLSQPKGWHKAVLDSFDVELETEEVAFASQSEPSGAMALLCAFLRLANPTKGTKNNTSFGHSSVAWVSDGVVIKKEKLSIRESLGVLVMISAEGLQTDLTGLDLRTGGEMTERKRHALWTIAGQLERLQASSKEGMEVTGSRSFWSYWGWGGLLMSLLSPALGMLMIGQSGLSWLTGDKETEHMDRNLDEGLENLIQGLKKWRPTG